MSSINKLEDYQIVEKIDGWDINMFSVIVERYEKKLLKYILNQSNVSIEDAENILQDVFIKVYKNINSYNSIYKFSSWIYRIAYTTTIDNYKKHKNINENTTSIDVDLWDWEWTTNSLLDLIEDENQNIHENLKRKELSSKVREIINQLEPKYKDVILLKYIEWMSYDEITDILTIPSNTVWTLINRAKKQIKKIAIAEDINNYL